MIIAIEYDETVVDELAAIEMVHSYIVYDRLPGEADFEISVETSALVQKSYTIKEKE